MTRVIGCRERTRLRAGAIGVLVSLLALLAGCSGVPGGVLAPMPGPGTAPDPATTEPASFDVIQPVGERQATSDDRAARDRLRNLETWENRPADAGEDVATGEHAIGFEDEGARNIVQAVNRVDERLRIKGRIQLNRIPGERVAPMNLAFSFGSCTDCETLTVALQLNLYERGASFVAPENYAVALNYECTRCRTVARAFQYTIPTDDPEDVPREVRELIKELQRELREVRKDRSIGIVEAERRIQGVIDRFVGLSEQLLADRDETVEVTSPGATALPIEESTPELEPDGVTSTTAESVGVVTPGATATSGAQTAALAWPSFTRFPVAGSGPGSRFDARSTLIVLQRLGEVLRTA